MFSFFTIKLLALAKWLDPIHRALLANSRVATFYGQVQNTQTNNADQHKLIMQINNRIDPAEVDGTRSKASCGPTRYRWGMHNNPELLQLLESWLKSYKPEELFDEQGALLPAIKATDPESEKRLGSTPDANGGLLRRDLQMPDFRQYGVKVDLPGTTEVENTKPLGVFLRDVMRNNMTNFQVFGPDENTSLQIFTPPNRLLYIKGRSRF
jgi:phosphoketolase